MSKIKKDLKVDKRVIQQLSNSAIKKDPIRAIVELITNSDDSYRRLEGAGTKTSGNIFVEIIRKRSNAIFRVVDQAEGFDFIKMDERVGGFGSNTSGLTEGKNVRGFFGRGLKEAIFGLGSGRIMSLIDGNFYECSLSEDAKYEREDQPAKVDEDLKEKLAKLGMFTTGTTVEIVVTKQGVTTPYTDNLAYQLERYFSLRDINSSPERHIYIIEKDEKGNTKKGRISLEYCSPIGTEVLNKKGLSIDGYPEAKFDLQVFKATELLSQDGACREGGLLIRGGTAIHEISLLGFEGNHYAQKLFGTVNCQFIDKLIKEDEPILSDRRDGIDWTHQYGRLLKAAIEKELKSVVEKIRKEEEGTHHAIENEKTRQRFKSAIEKINEIASNELGEDGTGRLGTEVGNPLNPPPNGFDFMPEYYHIIAGHRTTLTLKATVPWVLKNRTIITLSSENDDIIIETPFFEVKENEVNNNIAIFNPKVYGKRVGSEAIISAKAENYRAEAFVKVVAKTDKKQQHKKKEKDAEGGLIGDIKFDDTLGPSVRTYFEGETGAIKISSKHPSIEVYLGPNAEAQNELHCQVLVAELVTDSICRELARRKAEYGKLPVLGERMDAINREHNRLINKYAHVIHQFLVSPEARIENQPVNGKMKKNKV